MVLLYCFNTPGKHIYKYIHIRELICVYSLLISEMSLFLYREVKAQSQLECNTTGADGYSVSSLMRLGGCKMSTITLPAKKKKRSLAQVIKQAAAEPTPFTSLKVKEGIKNILPCYSIQQTFTSPRGVI